MVSRPVSGILWAPGLSARRPVAIHLCGLPEGCSATCVVVRKGDPCPLLGLAPGGVYRAARVAPDAGALLPHRFTLTCDRSPGPSAVCSLLHLSVRSPRPGSRQHPARWSPDFPRHGQRLRRRAAATRPTHHRTDQCTARSPEPDQQLCSLYTYVLAAGVWRRTVSRCPSSFAAPTTSSIADTVPNVDGMP